MKTKVTINGREIPLDRRILITGNGMYMVGRLLYFVLKTLNQMPRLYGVAESDPISGWRRNFENKFASIMTSHLDPGKIRLEGDFELNLGKFSVSGKLSRGQMKVTVNLAQRPENVSPGIRGMVEVDSFYFSDLERPKPFFVPGSKDGILAGFHRFLVLQTESASGVPKTLGMVSEFINSIVLPQGYSTSLRGKVLSTDEKEGLFLDGEPLYNVDPELLSLLSLRLSLDMAPEGSLLIVEDPEAHLSSEAIEEVKGWFSRFKGGVVFVSRSNLLGVEEIRF
ncbi:MULTISPECIES: hypothetical protein [Metallosphaera]|uniref:hypothetical protein n=1 Tax=Metallosphaera TaxID=41980 RepID=UPI000B18A048|nr:MULTISPECIES: hypothetical protein [Metallosphaera]MCH1772249.1 hypothetical protein [Metallosphaera sedula]MCP6728384.1 hypothetical protein [Metallosphaera sedula]MCY0863054.1 hypothetical protein [Metallosphaera prunae]WPX06982.1 hypothetical protein SOJ17_000722 [Metallosphaera sedula DSM 5348]